MREASSSVLEWTTRDLDMCRKPIHTQQHETNPRHFSAGNSAECIHGQHFAGVTWMFSPNPFLQGADVAVTA